MKRLLFCLSLVTVSLLIFSCKLSKPFSMAEKELIFAKNVTDEFRVLTVKRYEDSILLRTPSKDLVRFENSKALLHLIERMKVTMASEDGIGIAAPQIGINKNVFLFTRLKADTPNIQVVINPRIVRKPEQLVCFIGDGCLSIPDIQGNSKRWAWIEVTYWDEHGLKHQEVFEGYSRLSDFTGVIFQHEFDHLNGTLFIDKLCQ